MRSASSPRSVPRQAVLRRAALVASLGVGSLGGGCSLLSLDPLGDGEGVGGGAATTSPSATTSSGGGASSSSGAGGQPPTTTGGDGGSGAGGGAGGGGGSVPAPPCGGTSVLASGFDDDGALALWSAGDDGADARIESGELVLRPPPDGSNQYIAYSSRYDYDLRGDAISARFLETLDPAITDAGSSMVVQSPNGDFVAMRAEEGDLRLLSSVDDAYETHASTPLDLEQMPRWRLRHEVDALVAETSPDGERWAEVGRVAVSQLFDLSLVRVSFSARLPAPAAEPGVVRVDDVEGLHVGAAHCPARTFTDDFDDGSRSPEWGRSVTRGCGPEESGGVVRFPFVPSTSEYCHLGTSRLFDIRGTGVVIRMTSQSSAPTAEGYLQVEDLRGEGAIITAMGDSIAAMKRVPERVVLVDEPYVAADEPWWRIRDDAGVVRYEVSADGTSWRQLAEDVAWFDSAAVQLVVTGGTWDDPAMPGLVAFDDFNLPPP